MLILGPLGLALAAESDGFVNLPFCQLLNVPRPLTPPLALFSALFSSLLHMHTYLGMIAWRCVEA